MSRRYYCARIDFRHRPATGALRSSLSDGAAVGSWITWFKEIGERHPIFSHKNDTIWSSPATEARLILRKSKRYGMKSLADYFARDGFTVVRNIFSRDEIQDFRQRVQRQFEADQSEQKVLDDKWNHTEQKMGKGDLLSKPLLRDIVLDKRILDIARALLPPKPLVYFGDSSYFLGSGSRGFHRDNIDNKKAQGPDWVSPYTIIRMGVYLQDHVRHSGGLKVKVGSHLRDDGAPYLVDSANGDVVVWNLRTLHSGNAVRLRFWPNFHWIRPQRHLRRLKIGEGEIPIWLRLPLENQRMALFMSFGVDSPHLDRFIAEYMNKEPEPQERAKVSRFGEDVWETARSRQLSIRRLHPDYGTPLSR